MKRLLLIMLSLCTLVSLFGCSSGNEEVFHFDLIEKYYNKDGGKFYKDTINDALIPDFGTRYNARLYDIECGEDNTLTYIYQYDGQKEKTKGMSDMDDYVRLLNEDTETFTHVSGWVFKVNGTDSIVFITYYDMTYQATGLLVAIKVPTVGTKAVDKQDYIIESGDAD